jgi:hypothetical protein
MDPISVAILKCKADIPIDILKQAFLPKRYDPTRQDRYFDNVTSTSIDHQIRQLVVEGRVAIDANLCGGTEMFLPLAMAAREYVDQWNIVYRFNRDELGGRRIVTVHELIYGMQPGYSGQTTGYDSRGSQMLQVGRDILRATAGTTQMGTSYVQLVGVNTILVNDITQIVGNAAIRCTLTHEPNFNDLKPAYYHKFAEMVALACKAYIYNILIIELDEGQIRGGSTLGRIREIVDSYADAGQLYWDFLTTRWKKITTMNNTEQYRKILKLNLGAKPRY